MATRDFAEMLAGRPGDELLAELFTAYQELKATNEELHIQNEDLAATREALAAECRYYRQLFGCARKAM